MAEVHVKGLAELANFMQTLAPRIQRNVMRGALGAGMRVVQPAARANVRKISGKLAAGLKIKTSIRGDTVKAVLGATGEHAFAAHIIEWTGAKPHTIKAKNAKALVLRGGRLVESVEHPGIKKRPFMRPALDAEAARAIVAAAEYMKKRLATKEGIDTSDVVIEEF